MPAPATTPAPAPSRTDGRLARGDRTRRQILDLAVNLASVEGLGGLSIGVLAARLGMSKSGLFASFGSKEELQLATIDHAAQIFVEVAVLPGLARPRGLPRLWGLCDAWLRYADAQVFQGGCFFAAASAEFDGKPGPVHDRIAARMRDWLGTLERATRLSQEEGHLPPDLEPAQLAFELNSLVMGSNWQYQLMRDDRAFDRARVAIRSRLESLATAAAPSWPRSP